MVESSKIGKDLIIAWSFWASFGKELVVVYFNQRYGAEVVYMLFCNPPIWGYQPNEEKHIS